MKLLEADEEDLLEGKREVMGDLRKTERRRIAAEEKRTHAAISSQRAISISTASPIRATDSCITNLSFLSAEVPFNGGNPTKQTLQLPYKYLTKL